MVGRDIFRDKVFSVRVYSLELCGRDCSFLKRVGTSYECMLFGCWILERHTGECDQLLPAWRTNMCKSTEGVRLDG